MAKIPRDVWDECRATVERKAITLSYEELSVLLLELALEKESDQQLNAYSPGGGSSRSHERRSQGPRPGQATKPKNARIMSNVQELFWCDARDEQGCLPHAPDCDQRNCFVVQGKKQETNTGGKAKLPDHYRCTITCAFCGKRKRYEDECYHKQRLSAKLKKENGSGKGSGKGNTDRTKAGASPRAVANAKRRTKVDKEAVTASPTRRRTLTSPGGNPIPYQTYTSYNQTPLTTPGKILFPSTAHQRIIPLNSHAPKFASSAPLNKHPKKKRSSATRRTVTNTNTLHLNTPPAATAPTSQVTVP